MSNQIAEDSPLDVASDKPLVTFALFAYNQENFIQEAVEGALAQTYSPLEIILSDDNSSDRTFEIMRSLAAGYAGPHHLAVQQTMSNQGILAHVLNVVSRSKGDLIVLAAGDDISLPERVESLYQAWRETGAWGLYSRFDRINERGLITESSCHLHMREHFMRNYFFDGDEMDLVHGATSAYDRRAFSLIGQKNPGPILTEDGVMSFLLNLHGKKINFVDQCLVRYRTHTQSLSNTSQLAEVNETAITDREKRTSSYGKYFENLDELFLNLVDDVDLSRKGKVRREKIEADLRFNKMRSMWMETSFIKRLCFLIGSGRRSDIRWMLPRIFGIAAFAKAKSGFSKIRQK